MSKKTRKLGGGEHSVFLGVSQKDIQQLGLVATWQKTASSFLGDLTVALLGYETLGFQVNKQPGKLFAGISGGRKQLAGLTANWKDGSLINIRITIKTAEFFGLQFKQS